MDKKRFLIVPSRPTPNGPLHLGHIAGPYLRADILARYLKQSGHEVKMVSGSDVFDSYVLLSSYKEGKHPHEIINYYHNSIKEDLLAMDIDMNLYINILEEPFLTQFQTIIANTFATLHKQNAVIKQNEKLLYAVNNNKYIIGCWLTGKCPHCKKTVGSFFCETCGAHFKPEQVIHPQSKIDSDVCEWRNVTSHYLAITNVKKIIKSLNKLTVPTKYRKVILNHLSKEQVNFRLSHPGSWGISYPDQSTENIIFASASIIFHCLLYGSFYEKNAFHPKSDVIKIALFGKDVIIPYLIGTTAFKTTLDYFSGFNHFIINEFYQLEGQKFSTSRGHAIWAKDIIKKTQGISSDMVRFYLSHANLAQQSDSFNVKDFLSQSNSVFSKILHLINQSISQIAGNSHLMRHSTLSEKIHLILESQNNYLNVERLRIDKAIQNVLPWLDEHSTLISASDHYYWLKGLAIIFYPFTPALAKKIWRYLGHSEIPSFHFFYKYPRIQLQAPSFIYKPITFDDIKPCLPPELREEIA